MRHRQTRPGMTLTECVVSLAIISLVAAMLALAVSSAQNLLRLGDRTEKNALAAFTAEETQDAAASVENGSVTFSAGGESYTVEGSFVTGESDGVTLSSFEPGVTV